MKVRTSYDLGQWWYMNPGRTGSNPKSKRGATQLLHAWNALRFQQLSATQLWFHHFPIFFGEHWIFRTWSTINCNTACWKSLTFYCGTSQNAHQRVLLPAKKQRAPAHQLDTWRFWAWESQLSEHEKITVNHWHLVHSMKVCESGLQFFFSKKWNFAVNHWSGEWMVYKRKYHL